MPPWARWPTGCGSPPSGTSGGIEGGLCGYEPPPGRVRPRRRTGRRQLLYTPRAPRQAALKRPGRRRQHKPQPNVPGPLRESRGVLFLRPLPQPDAAPAQNIKTVAAYCIQRFLVLVWITVYTLFDVLSTSFGDIIRTDINKLRGGGAAVQRVPDQGLHMAAVVIPRLFQHSADTGFDRSPGAAALRCDHHVDLFVEGMDTFRLFFHQHDRTNQVRNANVLPFQTKRSQHFINFTFRFQVDTNSSSMNFRSPYKNQN